MLSRMNKNTNRFKAVRPSKATRRVPNLPDFDYLSELSTTQVEHQTVLEFLRTVPHKFHPDYVERFGGKVSRMANALQLAFVPAINPKLGVIRTYPVPLMQWMYTLQAPQFGWPALPLALEDLAREHREELRQHEGAKKHLAAAVEHAPTPAVREALAVVLTWLEGETKRIRGTVEPLKAVPAQ